MEEVFLAHLWSNFSKKNSHRLTILWMDCCNKFISGGPYATLMKEEFVIGQNEHLPGLHRLFLESRGLIVGCGAGRGESSIGLPDGGVFTNGLLSGLKAKCANDAVTWNEIFSYVASYCPQHVQSHQQHPIMQYVP